MNRALARMLVVSAVALVPAAASAGPPLVCWPMSIGGAASLPWGDGWHATFPGYDRARLAGDTVGLLGPRVPVLVHMETLRRAALYAATDETAARTLFDALRARVSRAEGEPRSQALAQFDLGYEAEAYRQALFASVHMGQPVTSASNGFTPPEDGLALVHQALDALRPDAEVEYAAALISLGRPASEPAHTLAQKHLRIAAARTVAGSDLARTLAAHARLWGGAVPVRAEAGEQ